jgi:hypothetical protein
MTTNKLQGTFAKILILSCCMLSTNSCNKLIKNLTPKPKECIKFAENPDTTCTSTHELLANKTWTFDSAFLNGQNITADCFKAFDKFTFFITDADFPYTPVFGAYTTHVSMNDTVFAFTAFNRTDTKDRPIVDSTISLHGDDPLLSPWVNRAFVIGLYRDQKAYEYIIRKLTSTELKIERTFGDSVSINHFSIH